MVHLSVLGLWLVAGGPCCPDQAIPSGCDSSSDRYAVLTWERQAASGEWVPCPQDMEFREDVLLRLHATMAVNEDHGCWLRCGQGLLITPTDVFPLFGYPETPVLWNIAPDPVTWFHHYEYLVTDLSYANPRTFETTATFFIGDSANAPWSQDNVTVANGGGEGSCQLYVDELKARIRIVPYNPCPADINGDFVADMEDLVLLMQVVGSSCGDEPCWTDTNGDGSTDVDDVMAVIDQWGECVP